jgi:hypothetical protein
MGEGRSEALQGDGAEPLLNAEGERIFRAEGQKV